MTQQRASVLSLDGLRAGYLVDVPVLHDVSVHVDAGEIVAIVGPNGAGKSTVLKAVMGLIEVTGGRVLLSGEDITGHKVHGVVRRGVSFVPQGQVVFPDMTVDENLDMAWFALGKSQVVDRGARREAVLELFPRLRGRLRQRAGSMSGGERQMVSLGRALMTDPKLILLDEPSLGLSPAFLGALLDSLASLREQGLGIAIVEQNAAMALGGADRGYVLDMGRVAYTGTGRELLASADVRRLYVGGAPRPRQAGGAPSAG